MKMLDSGDVSDHPYQRSFRRFSMHSTPAATCRSPVLTMPLSRIG